MTTVTLAPAIRQLIDETPRGVPAHLGPPEERAYMRLLSDLIFMRYGMPGPDVHTVTDHRVPVDGGEIPVRVYRPGAGRSARPPHVPRRRLEDRLVRGAGLGRRQPPAVPRGRLRGDRGRLPAGARAPVPGAARRLLRGAALGPEQRRRPGIDPANVSVGGSSAGGNLAAAVALRCRDAGDPALRAATARGAHIGPDPGDRAGHARVGRAARRSSADDDRRHPLLPGHPRRRARSVGVTAVRPGPRVGSRRRTS